ncbi:bifunctional hydroxymethylpyrimidine kinase/phosphomethylpyrimidine kinase [bacterium]|nr:MAG: bifunctional hydroxymethylpyrimidine kinase/phosphomethylpyrimidine kinase [bacterium]
MKAVCLTIAGSDSGGGAGIQADLKTFAAHGTFGTSAISLITAQNTRGVTAVQTLDPELVRAQIRAVLEDFPVAAVKTGALGNAAIIEVVADELRGRNLPLIVDPVMLAKSGDVLIEPNAVEVMKTQLFPLATLITPNLPEAEVLLGLETGSLSDEGAIQALLKSVAPFPVLLKGGHGEGATLYDHLWLSDGYQTWGAPRQNTRHTHGTGCTLSAAIAAQLALGASLPVAVERARDYVAAVMRNAPGLGGGAGPLEHFPPTWSLNS